MGIWQTYHMGRLVRNLSVECTFGSLILHNLFTPPDVLVFEEGPGLATVSCVKQLQSVISCLFLSGGGFGRATVTFFR